LIRENRTEQLQTGLRLQETVQASASAATRFLSSRNPADSNAAVVELQGMRDHVAQLGTSAADSTRVRRFLAAMVEPTQQFTDAIKEIIAATEQFRVAGSDRDKATGELSGLADSLRNQARTVQQRSAQSLAGVVVELGTMNLAISGGALIAGVLLAWLIGHGIAGPVGSLTAVMKALAAGDLDSEIGFRIGVTRLAKWRGRSASSKPVRSMFGAWRPRRRRRRSSPKLSGVPRC
jgi:hypothetical protein